MLSEIHIENLAVIEKARIEFGKNLNVFTGETGAGKSILINGINAILGHRTNKDIVRTGAEKALISAFFTDIPSDTVEKLSTYGFEPLENELLLQREISADGRSIVRIDGKIATNAILRDVSDTLINIHGQHDNQTLISSDNQRIILDRFSGIDNVLRSYKDNFRMLQEVARKIKKITLSEVEKQQTEEMLRYQIDEISSLKLKPGEDVTLSNELRMLRNSEKVQKSLHLIYESLHESDDSLGAMELVQNCIGEMEELVDFLPNALDMHSRLESISIELDDIRHEISGYISDVEDYGERLLSIESRLSEINRVKRKYGMSVQELINHLSACERELEHVQDNENIIEDLSERKREIFERVKEQAEEISRLRREGADKMTKAITNELEYLDMSSVRYRIEISKGNLTVNGMDSVEMLISVNRGEALKPIGKIASGGELSRIMLAIKNVIADKENIPTLIFDEVDTGISGRAAQKVGDKLSEIARNRQILCVTHLAQIAVMADQHLLIEKTNDNERTYTKVTNLDFEGRKREIARIIAGDSDTEITLKNAEEMLMRRETLKAVKGKPKKDKFKQKDDKHNDELSAETPPIKVSFNQSEIKSEITSDEAKVKIAEIQEIKSEVTEVKETVLEAVEAKDLSDETINISDE